jgi:EpsI family protein
MSSKILTVGALLLFTAIFLHRHARPEINPPRKALASFPRELGPLSGTDSYIPDDVRAILGPGDFLNRTYAAADGSSVELFIAYFASQQTGDAIHSPKNCLPGAGWTPLEVGHIAIPGLDQRPLEINRYVIAKGGRRLLVLYWYQAHNRITASEYWAKWYMLSDAITENRSDGALVRITALPLDREGLQPAERRGVEFAKQILPLLDAYIPR